jgi:hypothetical protein
MRENDQKTPIVKVDLRSITCPLLLERVEVASARERGAFNGNARNGQKTIDAPMES